MIMHIINLSAGRSAYLVNVLTCSQQSKYKMIIMKSNQKYVKNFLDALRKKIKISLIILRILTTNQWGTLE